MFTSASPRRVVCEGAGGSVEECPTLGRGSASDLVTGHAVLKRIRVHPTRAILEALPDLPAHERGMFSLRASRDSLTARRIPQA